ncbi:MAG: CPBP family intramembrane metalloprotease [Myxococcales bacterium]|nr:CPBP family intramembrane metalloprotease [Myxococcales bacterium]
MHELGARDRLATTRCSGSFAYLPFVMGLGQYCHRKDAEAAALALTGIADLATGLAVGTQSAQGFENPAAGFALVAYQDLWLAGIADMRIDRDLSKGLLYAPTDTLGDLVAAPFNWEVMKQPKVWGGILGAVAIGIGVTLALDGVPDGASPGDDANLFGKNVSPALGYPGAMAAFGGLFSHVAPAEELFFRGVVQSQLARHHGEGIGWVGGSLIFGAVHAPNALILPKEDRRDYVTYAVPVITVVGSYLGYLYKSSEYSLAAPTAMHFWYNTLLSATAFALDPQDSPVSASFGIGF